MALPPVPLPHVVVTSSPSPSRRRDLFSISLTTSRLPLSLPHGFMTNSPSPSQLRDSLWHSPSSSRLLRHLLDSLCCCDFSSDRTLSGFPTLGEFLIQKKLVLQRCLSCNLKDYGMDKLHYEENLKRRRLLIFMVSSGLFPTLPSSGKTKSKSPYDEKRLLEQNKRVQKENNAPDDFPSFVREGFEVKVVASESYMKRDSGLIFRDFEVGVGDCPKAGQQVTFHYVGYNESGRRIDSTYLQGTPAKIRLGTNALVPGFEEGIRDMKPGGKRRIIIPPELGPPVGPSTFFSSKQFEVFDVELLGVKDCERRTIGFYSDVVCN